MAVQNLWHPISEKPEKECLIVESKMYYMQAICPGRPLRIINPFQYNSNIDWNKHIKNTGYTEWCYADEWLERNSTSPTE